MSTFIWLDFTIIHSQLYPLNNFVKQAADFIASYDFVILLYTPYISRV